MRKKTCKVAFWLGSGGENVVSPSNSLHTSLLNNNNNNNDDDDDDDDDHNNNNNNNNNTKQTNKQTKKIIFRCQRTL